MNPNATKYLEDNKDKFPKEVLIEQLRKANYSEADIAESVKAVYGEELMASQVQPAGAVEYAGFWVRLAAIFIDNIVLFLAVIVLMLVLIFSSGLPMTSTLMPFLAIPLVWGYFIIMTYKYQSTLGKKMLGIKVLGDNLQNPTLGKVVLRETVGRIVSQIILQIGYVMAAFTKRKQGLHDMMAGTVVVYRDSSKKRNTAVIAVAIIAAIVFVVFIVGIFSSIVLVSLSSARAKAQDASVKASISSLVPEAILYNDENGTYAGFEIPKDFSMTACAGKPIVNVSADGKELAILGRYCDSRVGMYAPRYFCVDSEGNSGDVTAPDNNQTSCK